jgi:cell division protease FtsH
MSSALGLVAYETEPQAFLGGPGVPSRAYSEQTAREIDCAVRDLVQQAFETATGILTLARAVLEQGAKVVLEKESIGEAELGQLEAALRASSSLPAAREAEQGHRPARHLIAVVE